MDKQQATTGRGWQLAPAILLLGGLLLTAIGGLLPNSDPVGIPAAWKPFVHAHDRISLALGQQALGGVYITADALLPQTIAFPQDAAERAADALNTFAADTESSVYLLPVPTSAGIYGDLLPEHAPVANEHLFLRNIAGNLSDKVIWLEAESWLAAEKEQYIYYRTDPCWTSYGAYCVYRSAIRRLGFSAVGYDHFAVTHFSDSYRGRLVQQSCYDALQPDLVDLYHSDTEQPLRRVNAICTDGSRMQLSDYERPDYAAETGIATDVFGIRSVAVLQMETENQSSKDLLLLTDAFGGSMIPFLLQHYHTVTAINLPLATDINWQVLTADAYAQTLILCGTDTLADPRFSTALIVQKGNNDYVEE